MYFIFIKFFMYNIKKVKYRETFNIDSSNNFHKCAFFYVQFTETGNLDSKFVYAIGDNAASKS